MNDERPQRHAMLCAHGTEGLRQVAVPPERENEARGAEQVSHQETEHRDARGDEEQRAPRRPQRACGVGYGHAARPEIRPEQALAHDLEREIEKHDERDRGQGRAGHVSRGVLELARRHERRLHAGIGEHDEHHGGAERAPGGHVVDRKADLRPVDDDDPERREQEQGRQLERGQRRDRAGAELDAECIEREQCAVYGGEQERTRQRRRE